MWRGLFVAVGLSYASCCLFANAWFAGVSPNDPDVDKVLLRYQQVAAIFPLSQPFRTLPAYYLVFKVQGQKRWDWRLQAIEEVETALKTTPNSIYLQAHLHKLRWGTP